MGIDFPSVTYSSWPWQKSTVLCQGAYRTFSDRCSCYPMMDTKPCC